MKYQFVVEQIYKPTTSTPYRLTDFTVESVNRIYTINIDNDKLVIDGFYSNQHTAYRVNKLMNPLKVHKLFGCITSSFEGINMFAGWFFNMFTDGTAILEVFGSRRPLLELHKGVMKKIEV